MACGAGRGRGDMLAFLRRGRARGGAGEAFAGWREAVADTVLRNGGQTDSVPAERMCGVES